MQVAEVRRCLHSVRQAWSAHSPESPLNLSAAVPNGLQLHTFCFRFILAHHNKRMHRTKPEPAQIVDNGGDGGEDDDGAVPAPPSKV